MLTTCLLSTGGLMSSETDVLNELTLTISIIIEEFLAFLKSLYF